MTYSVESKNILAKLMATENINIVHQKLATAMFDPKTRTLYCPIWKDMSNELRDLLLGHETGHALETPADGWHTAATTRGKNFKAFLNVVEDARIEKKIKRRYPGLKRSFIQGYQELLDRDFFGIKDRDVNSLPFIDRLNLYTKGGVSLGIIFSDEETSLLNEVNGCETWDDVISVTEKVYGYSKTEQYEMEYQTIQIMMPDQGDDQEDDSDYDGNSPEIDPQDIEFNPSIESQSNGSKKSDEKDEESKSSSSKNAGESDDSKGEDEKSSSSKAENKNADEVKNSPAEDKEEKKEEAEKVSTSIQRFKATRNHEGVPADFEPVCETDDAFRANENSLIATKALGFTYANMPKPILKNIVVPYKKVQGRMTKYYKDEEYISSYQVELIDKAVSEFKYKNERYISLLAKEFEMRKAASKFAKAKVSNTGDLDVNKIYKYQVDENLFKKIMRMPKGKSHGLILLLDFSGSMQYNMASSIEQLLVLTMFCRKVNIPFVVYSFGNSEYSRKEEFPNKESSFPKNSGDVVLSDVSLREYLSSSMSNSEFKNAIRNMIALKKSFDGTRISRPITENLSNTPLIEAMIAIKSITVDFRNSNNLDIVNLVVVHDGDADYIDGRYDDSGYARGVYDNLVITDPATKHQITVYQNKNNNDRSDDLRAGIFDWYRQTTGAKIFGFFLLNSKTEAKRALGYRYCDDKGLNVLGKVEYERNDIYNLRFDPKVKAKVDELYAKKFLVSHTKGYNAFYLIPGGTDLSINDGDFEVEGKVTVTKLKTAFLKFNRKRQINRVLATKFIEGIAV